MPNIAKKHNRQSLRLKGYDYSCDGLYFVTICTYQKHYLFGNVNDEFVVLNEFGDIAEKCWEEIPQHFHNAILHQYIIMPNHIHGVIEIQGRDTACRAPTVEEFGKPIKHSIPTIVRSYKSAVTKNINELRNTQGAKVWQRNYFEHIIRNEKSYLEIAEYVINNPMKWHEDQYNLMGINNKE